MLLIPHGAGKPTCGGFVVTAVSGHLNFEWLGLCLSKSYRCDVKSEVVETTMFRLP